MHLHRARSFHPQARHHRAAQAGPWWSRSSRAPERKEAMAARQRQVRAILMRLARHGGWLAREELAEGARWQLMEPMEDGKGARPVETVSAALVQMLRQRGLVAPLREDDALRLGISVHGRRWLRLHLPGVSARACGLDAQRPPAAEQPDGRAMTPPRRRRQRRLTRDEDTGHLREVEVNVRENPLLWLARRKDAAGRPLLESHHVAAGERLRQEYEVACMQPNITSSWNPALVAADRGRLKSGPRDPFPFAERVMLARQRVQRALESIGPELADVVTTVCCLGHGLEAAERALNWPRRSARLVLRIALERLAEHYGLKPRQADAPGWLRTLGWHAADGKPRQLMPEEMDDAPVSRADS